MKFSLPAGPFHLGVFIENKNKKIITYLPDSDVLSTLKKEDKSSFNNTPENKTRLKKYIDYLKREDFWEQDEGYAFLQNHLPENHFSLLDMGCHVGQLAFYFKKTNQWDNVDYTGTDVMKVFIELAKQEHPKGSFRVSDLQKESVQEEFDVVLTKGTIISTFEPINSLKNVLAVSSKKTLLIHTPISNEPIHEEFYNILISGSDNVYSSSVLNKKVVEQYIADSGFRIASQNRRKGVFEVANKGTYSLYDYCLVKED